MATYALYKSIDQQPIIPFGGLKSSFSFQRTLTSIIWRVSRSGMIGYLDLLFGGMHGLLPKQHESSDLCKVSKAQSPN